MNRMWGRLGRWLFDPLWFYGCLLNMVAVYAVRPFLRPKDGADR